MTDRSPEAQVERARNIIAFSLIATFISVIPFLLFKDIPKTNEQIIVYMLGQLSGMATTILGFFFLKNVGQDAVDAKKAENTGKFTDAIVAVAQSTGNDPKADVVLKPGETATVEAAPETSKSVDSGG